MSEVAIILSDFHAVAGAGPDAGSASLPALARLGRFGRRQAVGDWRAWLAGWLGRADLAGAAPASVVAAALDPAGMDCGSAWLATPVHLQAGMRSVHLAHQGLLRLADAEAAALAQDFDRNFAARGFCLRPAVGAGWLAYGPHFDSWPVTTDPAQLLGTDIAGFTPQGAGAAPLLRLGAELEMWLHDHPLNVARARARRPTISTLWLWGGGLPGPLPAATGAAQCVVLGADAFAAGLSALAGARCLPRPDDAQQVLAAGRGCARIAVVVELFQLGLQALDAGLLAPLQAALGHNGLEQLHLVANGHVTRLAARDGLRFWRRRRPALAVLR